MNTVEKRQEIVFSARCRAIAAERLMEDQTFVQGMSIYYAGLAALTAVMGIAVPGKSYSLMSAVMTVALAALVVLQCALKSERRARQLTDNSLALRQLGESEASAEELSARHTELLRACENHARRDRQYALMLADREARQANGNAARRLFGYERVEFWMREISMMALKGALLAAPAVCFVLAAVGVI